MLDNETLRSFFTCGITARPHMVIPMMPGPMQRDEYIARLGAELDRATNSPEGEWRVQSARMLGGIGGRVPFASRRYYLWLASSTTYPTRWRVFCFVKAGARARCLPGPVWEGINPEDAQERFREFGTSALKYARLRADDGKTCGDWTFAQHFFHQGPDEGLTSLGQTG